MSISKKKKRGLQKHFEAILGVELDLDFPDEIVVRERVAAYAEQEGRFTSREIGTTGNSTKACADAVLLDVSGVARTGKEGTVELLLSDFVCGVRGYDLPAIVVATARAEAPVFLTARASLTSNRRDVRIRVASWEAGGSPAPNKVFNWMCRVPTTAIVD